MKTLSIKNNTITPQLNYQNINSQINAKPFQNVSFKGAPPKVSILDKMLKNKLAQGLFKLADMNPFAFNLTALAVSCIILRPPTIMVVPGSNKDDRKYMAGKSIIAATIADTSRVLLCLPLAMTMKKLGQKALAGKLNFPKEGTKEFEAFNYMVNNGFALLLVIGTSALMAWTVAKVMNILVPPHKNTDEIKSGDNVKLGKAFKAVKNSSSAKEDKTHAN